MKNLLFILLFIFSNQVFSQDCKYDRNEVDKFTGSAIIKTKMVTVYADRLSPTLKSMFFSFTKIDSSFYLQVSKWFASAWSVTKGDKLMIKLSDGKIITLESLDTKISSFVTGGWFMEVSFSLSKENLKTIQESTITDVRIYTTGSYIEDSVRLKDSEKIKISANCIK